MNKGKLFLVPSALSEFAPSTFLPNASKKMVFALDYFIAERAKTARQYLKSIGHPKPMSELNISELNKHEEDDLLELLSPCLEGKDVGLLSEAGAPGVADPGGVIVKKAHALGIEVMPLVGPSSLLLALMASGMNGQQFAFHGYLAKDESQMAQQLKSLEAESRAKSVTQMFIETPFRNLKMMDILLKHLNAKTYLCAASNLTAQDQQIISKTVEDWKKMKINFDRKPTVFLIYCGELKS